MRKSFIIICSMLVATAASADEQWSEDATREHRPEAAENRIIRWCSDDGSHQRYASANLNIAGYRPCGELAIPVACDPGGKRMITKEPMPAAYRDCSVGPRIVVERTDGPPIEEEPSEIGASASDSSGEPVSPLSTREKSNLKKELGAAERAQEQDLGIQLEKSLDLLLKSLLGAQASNGGGAGLGMFDEKQLEEMMRYVDPKDRKELKKLLKRK